MTAIQGFFRPIEITSSSDGITIDGTGYTIAQGLYSSILTVLYALEQEFTTEDANYHILPWNDPAGTSDNFRCVLWNADAVDTMTVTFTEDTLRDLLGFADAQDPVAVSPESTEAATYAPQYCWFPTHQSYDRERFSPMHEERADIIQTKSGRLSGVGSDTKRYQRTFRFAHETGVNAKEEAATTAFENVRCLDYFYDASRTTAPQSTTTTNPLGMFYLPDWTTYCYGTLPGGVATGTPITMTAGGINFDYASSPDKYIYCHTIGKADINTAPSIGVGRDYYNCDFTLRTADIPTFDDVP